MRHLGYLFDTHGHDLIIVTPTTPNAGWHFSPSDLKNGVSDGDMTIRSMMYIWMANFCGLPALTMPAGFVTPRKATGNIPVGLMGMGVWGGEEGLIEWGFEGEKYLHDVLEGGRLRSPLWSDVVGLAKEAKSSGGLPAGVQATTNGTNGAASGLDIKEAQKNVSGGSSLAEHQAPIASNV